MILVLHKRKQVKARVDLNVKKSLIKNPIVEFERSMSALHFDAYLASKVVEAHNFMPNVKVGRFVPVVVDHTTLLLC